MRYSIIISNPASRAFSPAKMDRAEHLLRQHGFRTVVRFTAHRGHATVLARNALREKPYCIIAAGGDGTINEVVNGMARSDIPLGILPLGTTNVLAREISIPLDTDSAASRLVSGTPREISLGRIITPSQDRYFCLMAGVGFDAKTVHDVNGTLKRFSGEAAYIWSGVSNLLSYAPQKISCTVDGKEYTGYSAIIGKARRYGGDYMATPDADICDPSLYLCLLTDKSRSALLRFALGIVRGTHLKDPHVVYVRAREIDVQGHAYIQLDGDLFGETPARIVTEPHALRLIQ
ncbi:MAG: diacylglycerol kinase family lipid kinase [Nitrospirae bacterium]|nr:diacylglycerol kinase family lipid kinase [Nitrospirota bacterium]